MSDGNGEKKWYFISNGMNPGTNIGAKWWYRGCVFLVGAALLAGILVCRYFDISRPSDLFAYRGMSGECDPVWKKFAWRNYKQGDSVQNLLLKHPPRLVQSFEPYQVLHYGPGFFTDFIVVSRSGKLMSAGAFSCTWRHSFFQDEQESGRFETAYRQFSQEDRARQAKEAVERDVQLLEAAFRDRRDVFLAQSVAFPVSAKATVVKAIIKKVIQGALTEGRLLTLPSEKVQITTGGTYNATAVFVAKEETGYFWCLSEKSLQECRGRENSK